MSALVIMLCSTHSAGAQSRPSQMVMPGRSYRAALPALTEHQAELRTRLVADVNHLAGEIGERNIVRRPENLVKAANFVADAFKRAEHRVFRQKFQVSSVECQNIIARIDGTARPNEIIIVGAHYDSVTRCPGANDNASGTAALLSLARTLKGAKPERSLRLVAFANEENPYFQTSQMGSWVYAKWCKSERHNIVGMISLETIGYYSSRRGSQNYPASLARYYPSEGNFIGFIGDTRSERLVKQAVGAFRQAVKFPSEGGALPAHLPGVGWSDHWSFWQHGYRAIMVTDTAPYRYPHYHRRTDTPNRLDYDRMARVVDGLEHVVNDLVTVKESAK